MFKHFLFIAIAIQVLTGCGIANQVRLRTANLDLDANWMANASKSTLPSKYIGEKPYVTMRVNDSTDLLFMVDSGATVSMLFDTEKTKGLQLEQGYELAMSGWGDGPDSEAYKSVLDKVQLGDVVFEDVTIGYIPLSATQYFLDPKQGIFDGVIGWDLMHHFSWTFDKQNNRIVIDSQPAQVADNATVVPFESFFTKLYVDASVAFNQTTEITGEFIIDTGSRHYVKLKQEYVDNRDIDIDSAKITAADFGLSGKAEHHRVSVPAFSLGDMELHNVKTNLIRGGDEDELWVIGSALLNQFVSVIDYHTSTLHLIPYPDHQFTTRYNLLGLELRKLTTGDFIVRYVMPELPAELAGFKAGDVVTKIDGINAREMSSEDWLALTARPGAHEICVMQAANAECTKITSTHIHGYSDKSS